MRLPQSWPITAAATPAMTRSWSVVLPNPRDLVLFPGNSVLTLAHTVRAVRWLLGTAHYNRQVRAESVLGFPDRSAHVEISAEDFAEFVTMVRPQISGLLEMSDRWLFQRSMNQKNRHQKKRLAGIHVLCV